MTPTPSQQMGSVMRISTASGAYNLECLSFNIAYGVTNEVVGSTDVFISTLTFTPIISGGNVVFS